MKPVMFNPPGRVFAPRNVASYASAAKAGYNVIKQNFPKETAQFERKIGEGVSNLTRGFKDKIKAATQSGSLVPVRLMKGMTSASGTGDVTETQFTADRNGSISSSVKTALASAVQLSTKSNQNGKIVSTLAGQGVSSLSSCSITGGTIAPSRLYYSTSAILGGVLAQGAINTPADWGALYSLYRSNPLSVTGQSVQNYNTTGYFYLDRAYGELTMSNIGTVSAIVDIYEVLSREDMGTNYNVDGTPAMPRSSAFDNLDPLFAWSNGMINYLQGDEISSFYTLQKMAPETIGCQPNASQYFNAFYEICAHHRVTMAVGAVHIHKSVYNYEQLVPVARMIRNGNLRGITRNILMTVRGPAGTTAGGNQVDLGATVVWTHNVTNSGKMIVPTTKVTTETFSDSVT